MTTATETIALVKIRRINKDNVRCLTNRGYKTLDELSELNEVEVVRILAGCPKRPDQAKNDVIREALDAFIKLRGAIEAQHPRFRFADGKKSRGTLKLEF